MRIALATVGTTGDIAPFAILARHLVARGHGVTAISWPVHRNALAQPGVRVEVAGPHADSARIVAVASDAAARGPMDQVAVLRDFHLADGEEHYRRLRVLLEGHDVVLLHGIHVLAHAAVLDLGVPWASAVFDPVLLPTASAPPPGLPRLGPLNRVAWGLLDRMLSRAAGPLDDVLRGGGSRQRGLPLFRARSERLHLLACSPSIIRVPPDLPPGTRVTGAWIDRSLPHPLGEEAERFLSEGAPPIVVAFGSMTGTPDEALDGAVEELLGGGRRLVIQGHAARRATSPNLWRVGPVDHRSLFPRASLVIHHGGAGTTHAACAAGVPSLVVPHVGDQRYWGERLHALGVAPPPQPVRGLRSERLADGARAAAVDPGMREAAQRLADRIGREDGIGSAIAALEGVPS